LTDGKMIPCVLNSSVCVQNPNLKGLGLGMILLPLALDSYLSKIITCLLLLFISVLHVVEVFTDCT
jgi:hypothetical protein